MRGVPTIYSKSSVNSYCYWFVELVIFALRGGAKDISIVRPAGAAREGRRRSIRPVSYNWIYSTDHKLFVYLPIQ